MVQWENENSVSVVSEKKVVSAVELKEGTTVVIFVNESDPRSNLHYLGSSENKA